MLVERIQPDGKFVLYYAADQIGNGGGRCIGAAVSGTAPGPYDPEASPLSCNTAQGGATDPAGFVDTDGTGKKEVSIQGRELLINISLVWVVWKVDGNRIGNGGDCNNSVEPIVSTVSFRLPTASVMVWALGY